MFGKTQGGLITRREECLKQQHTTVAVGSGFLEGGGVRTRVSVSSASPLQRELEKLCSHLRAVCILSGWKAILQTRADGAALAPVFGERWEANPGRWWQGESHLPRPGDGASNPTASEPLKQPRRVFSIHPHPGMYRHTSIPQGQIHQYTLTTPPQD